MTGKTPVNDGASIRARLLKVSKERREDFKLMLMNYAAERFLYRLSRSSRRSRFVRCGSCRWTDHPSDSERAPDQ